MEAHHGSMAKGVCQEDVTQLMDGVEARSEANVVPPPTKPNVVLLETEQPSSSPVVDAARQPL